MEPNDATATSAATTTTTTAAADRYSEINTDKNNSMKKKQSIRSCEEGDHGHGSVAVHSQVMKIKREIEKLKQPSLQQPEMRRVLLRNFNRQRSRSPLGLAERAILVGNS